MRYKWSIFLLLISCANQDEDMRLFMQSLQSQEDNVLPILPSGGVFAIVSTGQSNEEGGINLDLLPASDLLPMPDVQMSTYEFQNFDDYQAGINNKYKPEAQNRGMHLQLARIWGAEEVGTPLYIMKHGLGGTNIDAHLNRRYGDNPEIDGTNGIIYNRLLRDIEGVGINALINSSKRPFVYVYWCQGENDSFTSRVNGYSAKFDVWVDAWKTELGDEVPFIICTIIESDANDITINNVFRDKALTESNMRIIETGDLSDKGDGLHYDDASYDTIGDRCLAFMKELMPIEQTDLIVRIPDTMTLISVNESGGNLTIIADIEDGDIETIPDNLIFKIYDGSNLLTTTGSATNDTDVSIVKANWSYTVTIINVAITSGTKDITITSIDAGGNESLKSNIIQITI